MSFSEEYRIRLLPFSGRDFSVTNYGYFLKTFFFFCQLLLGDKNIS